MCSGAEKPPVDNSTTFPPPASGKLAAATAVESGRVGVIASVCLILPDLARSCPPSVVYICPTLRITTPCLPAVSTTFSKWIPVLL